jgi:hypothetical protein
VGTSGCKPKFWCQMMKVHNGRTHSRVHRSPFLPNADTVKYSSAMTRSFESAKACQIDLYLGFEQTRQNLQALRAFGPL